MNKFYYVLLDRNPLICVMFLRIHDLLIVLIYQKPLLKKKVKYNVFSFKENSTFFSQQEGFSLDSPTLMHDILHCAIYSLPALPHKHTYIYLNQECPGNETHNEIESNSQE